MSDALNMEDSLFKYYRNVYLIVFIYQVGVRSSRHEVTVVDIAEEIAK